MALYRKNPDGSVTCHSGQALDADEDARAAVGQRSGKPSSGLGRDFESLRGDNAPGEKKPLVVRKGAYVPATPISRRKEEPLAPRKTAERVGGGGKLVIRTDVLPSKPLHSARSARKGTTVLVRTERIGPQKRYHVSDHVTGEPTDYRLRRPIVIDPRKKKP